MNAWPSLLVIIAAGASGCASDSDTRTPLSPAATSTPHEHVHEPSGPSSIPTEGTAPAKPSPVRLDTDLPSSEQATSSGEPSPIAGGPPGAAEPKLTDAALRDELAAFEQAKPVFEAYCAKCHTSAANESAKGALRHFNIDSYPFEGHHASEITPTLRNVLGLSGHKATMPRDRPGIVQGEDLGLIVAWMAAYDRAHSGTRPHSHQH
jgi:hypothetical protein